MVPALTILPPEAKSWIDPAGLGEMGMGFDEAGLWLTTVALSRFATSAVMMTVHRQHLACRFVGAARLAVVVVVRS